MKWYKIDDGKTIGQIGSEGGSIIADDEYESMARITMEKGGRTASFSVTCGIYGWMVHTRFFDTLEEARIQIRLMKSRLESIVDGIPLDNESNDGDMKRVASEIYKFVKSFP
jgi:hypothetical protein